MIKTPGSYEIPNEMRDFAEKSVDQARKAFDGFLGAAQKAVSAADSQTINAQANSRDLAEKASVPISTIRRLEEFDGTLDTPQAKATAIRSTLERAGTEFIFPRTGKPGVRPR